MNYWTIPRTWEGSRVAVLASGPSLTKEDADAVRHLPRIVTNATYRIAPDCDIVYGSDSQFWRHPEYADVFDLPAIKLTLEQVPGIYPNGVPEGVFVVRQDGNGGYSNRPNTIRTGSNSGYAAIHLAASMGASEIVLLGFDLSGASHWHGKHPKGLHNPREGSFGRWILRYDALAKELQRRGVAVFNCSRQSALTCFQRTRLGALP